MTRAVQGVQACVQGSGMAESLAAQRLCRVCRVCRPYIGACVREGRAFRITRSGALTRIDPPAHPAHPAQAPSLLHFRLPPPCTDACTPCTHGRARAPMTLPRSLKGREEEGREA